MRKLMTALSLFLAVFFCLGVGRVYNPKTLDVNQDGEADVFYYHDGENVTGIHADTNYDGTHDVKIHIEDGNFKKAEIDVDHDGKHETQINDAAQFKKWVNENRPDFNDHLGWDNYSRKIDKVFWKPGEHN
jgi:hypothetical protein